MSMNSETDNFRNFLFFWNETDASEYTRIRNLKNEMNASGEKFMNQCTTHKIHLLSASQLYFHACCDG